MIYRRKILFLFCNVIEGRNRRRNTIEIGMPHIYSIYILTLSVIRLIIEILAICIQLTCDTIDVIRIKDTKKDNIKSAETGLILRTRV